MLYVNVGHHNTSRINYLIERGVKHFLVTDRSTLRFLLRLLNEVDIIVDNGAFQKKLDLKLLMLAKQLGLKFIMPDILCNRNKTVELHEKYHYLFDKKLSFVVAQGRSIKDYIKCVRKLENLFDFNKVATRGLLAKPKGYRDKIVLRVREVLGEDVWVHSLGHKTVHADSYDISIKYVKRHRETVELDRVIELYKKFNSLKKQLSLIHI